MRKIFSALVLVVAMSILLPAQAADGVFRGASYKAKIVNCEQWVSLRREPSTDSERLTEIPLGTIVTVYDGPVWGINGFYPVEYNGYCGYVLKEYLEYYSGGGAPRR